jgi:hypothetical protein
MERVDYHLLFRWFVGLSMGEKSEGSREREIPAAGSHPVSSPH